MNNNNNKYNGYTIRSSNVAIGKPPRKGRFLAGKILELNGDFSFAMFDWLVVSTPLKNIRQLGFFFPIYGKIRNVPNHQPVFRIL